MDIMRPTAKQIQESFTNLDFAVKCEMFLVSLTQWLTSYQYDLQSALFWASIFEMGLFFFGFILFLSAPRLLSFIWLHLFHLPRGFIGF